MNAKKISAWACKECKSIHKTEAAATACCCCKTCSTPLQARPGIHWMPSECDHCTYGDNLREARRRLRDAENDVETRSLRVQEMVTKGRPPKGSVTR